MDQDKTQEILAEIEAGYDLVSGKFSETRKHFWRDLEFIGDCAKYGDNLLDFGCGNGRLLELLNGKNIEYYGVDVSEKLIDLAREKHRANPSAHFQKISPQEAILPFSDNFFNAVYSIAVFHHLPSEKHRKDIIKELYRITKPGGCIIITVWNLWPASLRSSRGRQKKYIGGIIRNWKNKILGKSFLDWNDCYINFKNNEGEIFKRYHHAFTQRELKNLFTQAGFKMEKCEKIGNKNLIYVGKK